MNKYTLKQLEDSKLLPKAISFIYGLLSVMDLKYVDVNDWQCNLFPSVYIHNKGNMFKMIKYRRFSNRDLLNAIRFYKKEV